MNMQYRAGARGLSIGEMTHPVVDTPRGTPAGRNAADHKRRWSAPLSPALRRRYNKNIHAKHPLAHPGGHYPAARRRGSDLSAPKRRTSRRGPRESAGHGAGVDFGGPGLEMDRDFRTAGKPNHLPDHR